MAWVALVLYVVLIGSAFGLRSWLQRRATGSAGFHGISGRPGSTEWWGGVLFVFALVLGFAAPVADLAGLVEPIAALDGAVAHTVGSALALAGIALTLAAQHAMGRSWRIGVDAAERTELVTGGPFRLVRNPFFAALLPTSIGLALIVPNALALAGLVTLLAAIEIQVRLVEEPYLLQTHGEEYRRYAAAVGRFVPGIGRLKTRPTATTIP